MHFSAFSNTFVFLHNFMGKFLVFPRPLQRLTVHLLYVNLFESSQEMHSSFEKCVPNSIFCTATFSPALSSISAKQLDGNYGVHHAVHTWTVSTQGLFTRAAVSKQRPAPRDICASRQRISFVETAGRPAPLVDLHTPPFPSGNGGPIQLISGNAERPRLCLAKRCSFRFSWASPLFAHHFFGTEFSPTLEFFSPALTDARQFPIPVVGAQPTNSSDSGSDGW